jgi:hypothetical protein
MDIEDNRNGRKGDLELVVTAWQDFGRGEEPFDVDFHSHFIEGDRQSPKSVRPLLVVLKKRSRMRRAVGQRLRTEEDER